MLLVVLGQVNGNWPTFGGDETHRSLQLTKGAMASAPSVKWVFTDTMALGVDHFSAIADVDLDGFNEVIVGNYGGGYGYYTVYCFDGSTGSVEWAFTATTNWIYSTSVADVDDDGFPDVLVSADNGLYCLKGSDGTLKWSVVAAGAVYGAPGVGDVDGDGQTEVVVANTATTNPVLFCLSGADGSEEWRQYWGVRSESSPVILDVDGDSSPEILVGSADGALRCLRGTDGSQKWVFTTDTAMYNHSPAVADLDRDGALEVLIADMKGNLYCVSGAGTLKWRFNGDNYPSAISSRVQPAIGDGDGDGQLEVYFSCDTMAFCLDGATGAQEWAVPIGGGSVYADRPVSLADYDGDNRFEVLITAVNYYQRDSLILLNAEDGSEVWSLWVEERLQKPFPGDVDGDGCIEIVVATINDNSLRVLDDAADQSGCGTLFQGTQEAAAKGKLALRQQGNALVLKVPRSGEFRVLLYEPSGRLAGVLFAGWLPVGEHRFPIPAGVHIARVGSKSAVLVR